MARCVYIATTQLATYLYVAILLCLNSNNNSAHMHAWCVLVHVSASKNCTLARCFRDIALLRTYILHRTCSIYIYTVQVNYYILLYYYDMYYEYVYIA